MTLSSPSNTSKALFLIYWFFSFKRIEKHPLRPQAGPGGLLEDIDLDELAGQI